MTEERQFNITYLLVALIPIAFVVGAWGAITFMEDDEPEGTGDEYITVSQTIDFGDGTDIVLTDVETNATTVYTLLLALGEKDLGNYTVSASYWPSFDSMLVDSIGGHTNGDGSKYWEYKVNDELPMVGADKLEINDGDVITWEFEVPTWIR